MNGYEVVRRIAVVLRAIGILVLALGAIAASQHPAGNIAPVVIMSVIVAAPFLLISWIVGGLNHAACR